MQRPGAQDDYTVDEIKKAENRFALMSGEEKQRLFSNVLLGLPGSDIPFTAAEMLASLNKYDGIDTAKLREHLFYFLKQVVPVAHECDVRLAIHPDDPPYPLLGLPRIVSTEKDLQDIY